MDYHKFMQAAIRLEQAASARRQSSSAATEQEVADAIGRGDRSRAIAAIEALLARYPRAARWWHELASIRLQEGDADSAVAAWRQALRGELEDVALLHQVGQGLAAAGHDPAGFAEHAWSSPAREPPLAPEWRQACLDVLRDDWAKALPLLKRMQQAEPADRQAALNLAYLLDRLDRPGQSRCVRAANRLARGKAHKAAETFEAAPAAVARSPEFVGDFLRALRLAGKEERAIQIAETLAPGSCTSVACLEWAKALLDLGRHDEATRTLRRGAVQHDDAYLELQAGLILPPVPVSQAAMDETHRRACHAIHALSERPLPASPDALVSLEQALGPNFFLSYMGDPRVEEARAYAHFMERVVQARYPQYRERRPARRRDPGERIRIGYATSYATEHVVMLYFAGWLERADRAAFEIHLFPLASEKSRVTGYLASLVDVCHAPVSATEAAARQIFESELDVLVYPEIGTDAMSMRLAAMRLAPVQCVASGHPATTGLASLDYFLSLAGAEPADAAKHYTERLVALPGTGVCMSLPELPAARKSRTDFGLAPDQVIYLSPQSLFKYLPCHDEVFARIAESVDNAMFVFVEGDYPAWTRTFAERLRRTFEVRGLDADRHLRFVPRQDYYSFLDLNTVSDVFLDPLGGFSAGVTALDAVVCGLPMVTLPGALMRTRIAYGMLVRLGVEDAIAVDLEDYVRLAIRMGQDAGWRAKLSGRIQERRHLLFGDVCGVKGLEAFFRWAAGSARPGDETLFELGPVPVRPGLPSSSLPDPGAPDPDVERRDPLHSDARPGVMS